MSMKKLLTNWSLPDRTEERAQITLRLDFDSYARLHALKEVYPKRSVNDMINDILKNGLDEIIEALPVRKMTLEEAEEAAYHTNDPIEDFIGSPTGPRITFDWAYKRILESKSEDESTKLEVVQ